MFFYTYPKKSFSFYVTFILSSANAFNVDQSENMSFSKELSCLLEFGLVRLGFYAVSTLFQLFKCDGSQIHVSSIFYQY